MNFSKISKMSKMAEKVDLNSQFFGHFCDILVRFLLLVHQYYTLHWSE